MKRIESMVTAICVLGDRLAALGRLTVPVHGLTFGDEQSRDRLRVAGVVCLGEGLGAGPNRRLVGLAWGRLRFGRFRFLRRRLLFGRPRLVPGRREEESGCGQHGGRSRECPFGLHRTSLLGIFQDRLGTRRVCRDRPGIDLPRKLGKRQTSAYWTLV
jgi:hypothetical protein